ncbi:cyclase family protein [Listeria sp. ILCC792]|uniref:cyclase family protein n=1 Tax=Listeria sp. ILCC792 TaxID=1918331 RepID=UPI000B58B56A|nr:cyclase family protein [Listeria sp. ILCC792]
MAYVDLSHTIGGRSPVYPGDSATNIVQTRFFEKDGYVIHEVETNLHVGTHVDMPMHLVPDARFAAAFPVEAFTGKAVLFDVRGLSEIDWQTQFECVKPGDIVLFYTGFDAYYGEEKYYTQHPILTENLAKMLVEKQIKMVGIDTPSPDFAPFIVHQTLLAAGIFILENLTNLHALLSAPEVELHAVPLKIEAEASIVRAYAKI